MSAPIFTRLLTKENFGTFNNFTAWVSLLLVIASLDLYAAVPRAKFDFENLYGFTSSISIVSIVFTVLIYCVVFVFQSFFQRMFGLEMKYINLMFIYLLLYPAFINFTSIQQVNGRYKLFSFLTILSSGLSMAVSVLLVVFMDNKLEGRIIGYVVPISAICIILFIIIFVKGRSVNISSIKYALKIAIPLIPHTLSGNILGTSDRVIITNISGEKYTALYSLAYTCAMVVTLLATSVNQAYVPWLMESLHSKKSEPVSRNANMLLIGMGIIVTGITLVSPEILLIAGGKEYIEAMWIMPPVLIGCFIQFAYTLYVNVELYLKKSLIISVGTVTVAIVNVVLNFWLIPQFGYIAAAFTTLLSYALLFTIHCVFVCKTEYKNLYNNSFIIKILLFFTVLVLLLYWLYNFTLIRYFVVLLYVAFLCILFLNRKKLMNLVGWTNKT